MAKVAEAISTIYDVNLTASYVPALVDKHRHMTAGRFENTYVSGQQCHSVKVRLGKQNRTTGGGRRRHHALKFKPLIYVKKMVPKERLTPQHADYDCVFPVFSYFTSVR